MDNLGSVWRKFHEERVEDLFGRFPGFYRAIVVETNDPLQFHRIRIIVPELHNFDLKDSPEKCPWAVPAPWLGGKNAGSWVSPIIGDIVWITWEKNHPYVPIWCGFAMGSRRKRYPMESIYIESPLSLNEDGTAADRPEDFLQEYLPKDFRPMSLGWRDRYGNFDVSRSVGYFPIEHDLTPSPVGQDAVSEVNFAVGNRPESNNPDQKYMIRGTKGGGYEIMSDVGYDWRRDGDFGEFVGDDEEDRDFEIEKFKYLTRLFNEDNPSGDDQRRHEIRTRSGHKFEMRDVGWAQDGGGRTGSEDAGQTKTRNGEYGEPRIISRNNSSDQRWIKVRTKGGMIFQAIDIGFHPEDDKFYKRQLINEVGVNADGEQDDEWTTRDARQIRIVSRYGSKFVIDDRGSDPVDAEGNGEVKANGLMLKTRRGWQSNGLGDNGEPTGFAFEINEKDELNTSRWYSAKSKIIELNDRHDYVMMCTDTNREISRPWQKLRENEFALRVAMTEDPEQDTYHLKLDKKHGYLRLKTASGGDNGRRSDSLSDAIVGLNQGLEARDGRVGADGAWVELVDVDDRGLWFSNRNELTVWRSSDTQFVAISDGENSIIVRNNESGPIQLFSLGDIEVVSQQNIALKSANRITMKATNEIVMEAGGSHAVLRPGVFGTDGTLSGATVLGRLPQAFPGTGAQSAAPVSGNALSPQPRNVSKIKPTDRAEVSGSFDEVDEQVIKE